MHIDYFQQKIQLDPLSCSAVPCSNMQMVVLGSVEVKWYGLAYDYLIIFLLSWAVIPPSCTTSGWLKTWSA